MVVVLRVIELETQVDVKTIDPGRRKLASSVHTQCITGGVRELRVRPFVCFGKEHEQVPTYQTN